MVWMGDNAQVGLLPRTKAVRCCYVFSEGRARRGLASGVFLGFVCVFTATNTLNNVMTINGTTTCVNSSIHLLNYNFLLTCKWSWDQLKEVVEAAFLQDPRVVYAPWPPHSTIDDDQLVIANELNIDRVLPESVCVDTFKLVRADDGDLGAVYGPPNIGKAAPLVEADHRRVGLPLCWQPNKIIDLACQGSGNPVHNPPDRPLANTVQVADQNIKRAGSIVLESNA